MKKKGEEVRGADETGEIKQILGEAYLNLSGWLIYTFQVHACHQTLAEAAGWAVLPSDLVYYAVVPTSTQVIMLP